MKYYPYKNEEEYLNKGLLHAAMHENWDSMKHWLGQGADINTIDYKNGSILHQAILNDKLNDNYEIVEYLISQGADINIKIFNGGSTSLISAIRLEREEIVKLLIYEGADVNVVCSYDTTPLFEALRYSSIEIISLLLEKGADANFTRPPSGYRGESILDSAIRRCCSLDVIELLLKNGADPNIASQSIWSWGRYVIGRAAIKQKDIAKTKLLLEYGADPNPEDYYRGVLKKTTLLEYLNSKQNEEYEEMIELISGYISTDPESKQDEVEIIGGQDSAV